MKAFNVIVALCAMIAVMMAIGTVSADVVVPPGVPLAYAVAQDVERELYGLEMEAAMEEQQAEAMLQKRAMLETHAEYEADDTQLLEAEAGADAEAEVEDEAIAEAEADLESEVEAEGEGAADAELEADTQHAAETEETADLEADMQADDAAEAEAEADESFVELGDPDKPENPTYVLPYPPVLPGHYTPLFNPYTNVNPLSTPFANYAAQPGAHPGVAAAAAAQAGGLAAVNGQVAGAAGGYPYYPYAARNPIIAAQLTGNPVPFSGYAGWIHPQNLNSAAVGDNSEMTEGFPALVEVDAEVEVGECVGCSY